jgi:serine/threonine-protein kinase
MGEPEVPPHSRADPASGAGAEPSQTSDADGTLDGKGPRPTHLGRRLGKYLLESVLGRGGMGTVYRAKHVELGGWFAIKLLDRDASPSKSQVQRFFQEARAAAQIGHAHIVKVFDFAEDELGAYIVMELLEGATLAQTLLDDGPLEIARVVAIALQLCDGLGAAHKLGIIHRDIKPANVFLTRVMDQEVAKLMDFGVAKMPDPGELAMTQPGMRLGTPLYMSPEQWEAAPIDARADLYSLGAVLYEMTTGMPPFPGTSFGALIKAHAVSAPRSPRVMRPDLPPSLESIILRCLAKDPAERFAGAEEVARALAAVTSAAPPAPRRRRARLYVALTAGVTALAAIGFGLAHRRATPDAPAVVAPAVVAPAPAVVAPAPLDAALAPAITPAAPPTGASPTKPAKKPTRHTPAKRPNLLFGD